MDAFETRYAALNAEQKEAVDAIEGPVMVIAGPGTGKTEVLTLRIANIVRHGAAPEKILALTFTESGAVSMRRRLSEFLGQEAYRVEISTFHGFGNRLIRDYPDYFPDIVGAVSITDIDQIGIVQKLIDTIDLSKLRPFGDSYYYLKDILHALDELKKQGVSPEQFSKIAADEKEVFYANPDLYNTAGKYEGKMKGKYDAGAKRVEKNLELVRVYEAYQAALRAAKQYDYSDMIMYVALALEKNEDFQKVLGATYDYFLVDEHQDTNDAQNKIIEFLADGGDDVPRTTYQVPNLFVVGDEKQAIFRFQGASLENFHYFKNRYKNVKLISLRNNYRSTQAILNAAQSVSPRETELVAKAGHVERPANLAVLSAPDVEYYFIARKIKELLVLPLSEGEQEGVIVSKLENITPPNLPSERGGIKPENIAVLYRDNKDVIPLARILEKLKVPFNIESDQDVLGDEEIKKLIRILRAIQHFGSDVWLIEALHLDFLNIPPLDVYKIAAGARRERRKIWDLIRFEAALDQLGVESRNACLALAKSLSDWKRVAENQGAVLAFETIVRDSGFLAAVLRHPSATEKLMKLHALFDLLKSFVERKKDYTLRDFFVYLDLVEAHGVAVKSKDTVRLPGRVRLMTAHRAKGMEFDYVFVMNAVDRKWGSRFHRESLALPKKIYRVLQNVEAELEDDNADERNVFYVALTRAKKELFVTMSRTDQDGKEQLPTQFIAELKQEILRPLDVAPYEADFAAHCAEIEFAPAVQKTPELKDKEFLNALFDEQGLSVTAVNNYLECPWHYFYVNLVRIPEAPNKHLSFGNAVHAALKGYFDAFAEGDDRGKTYLVARFEDALAREPIQESEYEEALAKGRRALSAFYDEYRAGWSPRAVNELRIDGVESGTVKIKGSLDRVEFLDSLSSVAGAKEDVRVIDYKTGKPKTRNEIEGNTKSSDGNYKRQLVFYKLLLEKNGKYDMQEGVIQFIEPDERGKFHRESFSVSSAEVAALETQVAGIAREITDLAFWNAGCHDPKCRYCELRKDMEKK